MGNTAVKDKSRHFSGDDAGPMMSTDRPDEDYIFRSAYHPLPGQEYSGAFPVSSTAFFLSVCCAVKFFWSSVVKRTQGTGTFLDDLPKMATPERLTSVRRRRNFSSPFPRDFVPVGTAQLGGDGVGVEGPRLSGKFEPPCL